MKCRSVFIPYQRDIEGYAQWQAGNCQLNRELLEYNRMKEYYEGKDEVPPYTTLAGFRRARRAQATEYKENRKVWDTMQEKPLNNLTDWKMSGKIGIESNPNAKIDCAISWEIVNTKAHKDEIGKLIGNKSVEKTVAKIETEILNHRQGTEYEDLYLIDFRTGKAVASNLTSTELLKVGKTKEMEDVLSANDGKDYVIIHNHPYSSPPSVADLNSLFRHPKIKYGVIIGHNGTIYKYTAPNAEIKEDDLDCLIKHYRGLKYSQITAEEKAYNSMRKKYNFKMEVLNNGK